MLLSSLCSCSPYQGFLQASTTVVSLLSGGAQRQTYPMDAERSFSAFFAFASCMIRLHFSRGECGLTPDANNRNHHIQCLGQEKREHAGVQSVNGGHSQCRTLANLDLQAMDQQAQPLALCREPGRTVEDFNGSFSDENMIVGSAAFLTKRRAKGCPFKADEMCRLYANRLSALDHDQ